MPYIITATLFRLLDSIQQFDIIYAMTQGGPGDTLLVFQVQAYLDFFQYTNVGRSAALMIILWAITYVLSNIFVKQWLKLRERAHGAALRRMDHTSPLETAAARRRSRAGAPVLPVPDLLDRADVVPDERDDPAHPAVACSSRRRSTTTPR